MKFNVEIKISLKNMFCFVLSLLFVWQPFTATASKLFLRGELPSDIDPSIVSTIETRSDHICVDHCSRDMECKAACFTPPYNCLLITQLEKRSSNKTRICYIREWKYSEGLNTVKTTNNSKTLGTPSPNSHAPTEEILVSTYSSHDTTVSEAGIYTSSHASEISTTTRIASTDSSLVSSTTNMVLTTTPTPVSSFYTMFVKKTFNLTTVCPEKYFLAGFGFDAYSQLKELVCLFLNVVPSNITSVDTVNDTEQNSDRCSVTLGPQKRGAVKGVEAIVTSTGIFQADVDGKLVCGEFPSVDADRWEVIEELITSYSNNSKLPDEISCSAVSVRFSYCPVSLIEENLIWVVDSLFEYTVSGQKHPNWGIKCIKMKFLTEDLKPYLENAM